MGQGVGRVPATITDAPLRTVRPVMLRGLYANPEKELVRMRDAGTLVQIARGTYTAKPDTVAPGELWAPPVEEAAMAYATAAYGDRVPVLAGVGAARWWHAIPRAVAVTVVAVPEQHRPVTLTTGGTVVFTVRQAGTLATVAVPGTLGTFLVTTAEQTLIDLVTRRNLGGIPDEATDAARVLAPRIDTTRLRELLDTGPMTAAATVTAFLAATL